MLEIVTLRANLQALNLTMVTEDRRTFLRALRMGADEYVGYLTGARFPSGPVLKAVQTYFNLPEYVNLARDPLAPELLATARSWMHQKRRGARAANASEHRLAA